MNKIIAVLAALTMAPAALADTVFGVYAGGGQWRADYDGDLGDPSIRLNELGLNKSNNNFYFVALEHAVPIIPNIKLQQTNISSRQTALISRTFTLNEVSFIIDSEVTSDFDLSHTDAVFYYEALDNWINLDLGLTLRKFDGHATASNELRTESVNLDEFIPLIYAKGQFNLPLTGFALGGAINAINYSDNRITDYNAYISYTFDSALDIGAELGYRSLTLKADEDDVKVDAELAGPYAGVLLHF